jgi:hypothetical protein
MPELSDTRSLRFDRHSLGLLDPADQPLHQGLDYFKAHLDSYCGHDGFSSFGDVAHAAPQDQMLLAAFSKPVSSGSPRRVLSSYCFAETCASLSRLGRLDRDAEEGFLHWHGCTVILMGVSRFLLPQQHCSIWYSVFTLTVEIGDYRANCTQDAQRSTDLYPDSLEISTHLILFFGEHRHRSRHGLHLMFEAIQFCHELSMLKVSRSHSCA